MPLKQLHSVTGECACAQVTYRCTIESETAICSCDTCRHGSGSAFHGWVNGSRASLHVAGQTSAWASSDHATREFCTACGSSLFLFEQAEPEVVEVATGTLNEPHGIVSSRQTCAYLQKMAFLGRALVDARRRSEPSTSVVG